MEDAPEQRQVVVGRRDQVGVEERERDLVAGAVDDDVGVLLAAVGEPHRALGQLGDVRLRRDLAVRDPREDVVGHRRVGAAERVVGLRQAVALHVADRQPQRRGLHPLAQRDRYRGRARGSESIGRPKTYFGITHAPRRAARKVRRATNDDSTAMSIAELPIPSTTTERSRNSAGSSPVYSWECICTPAKRSCPGNAGSGQRGSQWWPLATIERVVAARLAARRW